MTIISARVALQQRVFPDYRAPFFNLLAKSCLQGFSLFTGLPREEEAITTTAELKIADYVPGHNIHISRGKTYFCFQQGLIRWLEHWQPNVLIVEANPRYLSTPAAIQWMHARHRPVIGWGLGTPSAGIAERLLVRPFFRSLDAVIAYSQTGAKQYAGFGINPARIFVAANAAVCRPNHAAPFRPDRFQGNTPNVLYVGRLQERKRLEFLLEACAALPSQLQPHLVVIGDGPDRARLEGIAAKIYTDVQFTGAKHGAELEPFYNKADLFVLPGTGGLAVQQAMAHALPVIVGQADGTQSELVRSENGWVLPNADVFTLSNTLQTAFSDIKKLRQMGLASFRIVVEEVNLENMVENFSKAIKSVI